MNGGKDVRSIFCQLQKKVIPLIRLRIKLRPSVAIVDLRPTKAADAKARYNSSVLAPFLSPELALGFIPVD
jgi:hypothetical protein